MMAPESESAMDDVRCIQCGKCGWPMLHNACTNLQCPKPTLTCSEVVERLPSEPCPACGDRNRCPSCKRHEGNPHDTTCRAFRAQLKKFIHDSCRQIPDDDGSISDLAAALVKQYPSILHSWRERRVQELEEALRKIANGNTVCERCSQMSADAGDALSRVQGK